MNQPKIPFIIGFVNSILSVVNLKSLFKPIFPTAAVKRGPEIRMINKSLKDMLVFPVAKTQGHDL